VLISGIRNLSETFNRDALQSLPAIELESLERAAVSRTEDRDGRCNAMVPQDLGNVPERARAKRRSVRRAASFAPLGDDYVRRV
jgi:hypothetical protein